VSNTDTVPEVLFEKRTADLLDVTPTSLRQDRYRGVGLPYVRIRRRIRYRADDVAAYIAATPSRRDRGSRAAVRSGCLTSSIRCLGTLIDHPRLFFCFKQSLN
jgi:hypothetical protein